MGSDVEEPPLRLVLTILFSGESMGTGSPGLVTGAAGVVAAGVVAAGVVVAGAGVPPQADSMDTNNKNVSTNATFFLMNVYLLVFWKDFALG